MSRKLLNLCMTALFSVVSTAAWALSEVNGVYQIGTAEDLVAFAEFVNAGNAYANAVLTADIDRGADLTMIGKDGLDYQGTFDGQGHTITVSSINQAKEGTAIFRNVGKNAVIQNLKVQGTITTNQKLAAGIAAWCSGTIRGCYADISVTSAVAGDATHAGIAAVAYNPTVIENCLAKITIKGAATQNCGGIVGWASGRTNIVNCLVISDGSSFDLSNNGSANISRNDGNINVVNLANYNQDNYNNRPTGVSYNNYATKQWGNNKATTVVAYDDLADGRICYQLNNDQSRIGWVQEIGVDAFPVPAAFGSAQVYASGVTECDGKSEANLTFSNEGTVQATAHQFDKFGVCSVCGYFDFLAVERDAEGTIILRSPKDIDLAESLNRFHDGLLFNLKMEADIEYTAEPGRYIFNTGNWVNGSFDGQGHTLTIAMSDMGSNASLFPQLAAKFENVIMHGSISTTGQYAGSISSHTRSDKVQIRNVFSDINITATRAGDNTIGGLIGVVETKTLVDNTIYAGSIVGTENTECIAGFSGWASGQTYFTNCAFLGTITGDNGDSQTLSRNPSNITCDNVYSAGSYGRNEDEGKYTLVEEEAVESGELAYNLNGKAGGVDRFYQKIGEDLFPMPIAKEGALVYASAASYRCDGAPEGETVYTNNPSSAVLPPHEYEEGFCSVCGNLQEDYMTPVDGWFEISNGAELVWWTNYAAKHLDASARLTDDINMEGYCDRWANVGKEQAPFYGNFDGQFHTISNLVVEHNGDNGVGLIAVMNSLPSKGFGGISDEDARNAEGVYIKNVVLDESCSLTGRGYVALVGMTAPWAGHVNIKGVMMCGDVTADGGPNAAGVFGCVMSSSCHVTIDNCGMVGNVYGPKENGSFSGWLGDWAEVTNCFAVGEVEGIESQERYFARYGNSRVNDNIKNCYARYGKQEHVGIVSEEDFASGALAWRANGSQFRTGYWYQTIGEDSYPFADPSHGTVIYGAEKYFSVANDEDLEEVSAAIQTFEEKAIEEIVATQALLDDYKEAVEALTDAATLLEFADAVDTLEAKKGTLAENVAIYKAYKDKCEEIKARLETDDTFSGSLRDALEAYLEDYEEPSEENPLGTYDYIMAEHLATGEEILAETERVIQWLADAIAEDYQPGTDISSLIVNGDFSKQKEGWTDAFCTGYGKVKVSSDVENYETLNKTQGVEAWNVTGDMYQTIENLKPGYYLIGTNAAFRPSNNRYSTNYAAGIYANGIFNYFPTVIEDPVPVDEAIDQENCNLHGDGALDLKIYEDGETTSGLDSIGYVVHGPSGMAAAANAGRYQVYTIGKVEEDGKLTIGIKNPGTKYGNDWTGWSAIKMTYCGDDADEALATVIENMAARATTLMEHEIDTEADGYVGASDPNFPFAIREELEAVAAEAESPEDKAALVARFSEIFQSIYEGKQAYIALHNAARSLEAIEAGNLPLAEKDLETDEWFETDELVFSEDETDALYEASQELFDAYNMGSYSTEEALNATAKSLQDFAEIVAPQDEEGFYQVGTPKQFVGFRAISMFVDNTIKAKLAADIDMAGIAMQPINDLDNRFHGTLDGQGYALNNVYIAHYAENTALFGGMDGATVKNLKLTGEYYSDSKYIAGIVGKTYGKCTIDNCEVAVKMYSTVNGDGTHGGLIGVNEESGTVVSNCIVNCPMFGEETTSCGGVCGWATNNLTVNNTLILSQDITISSEGSNIVCREDNSSNVTVNNVFYVKAWGGTKGSLATAEQLASGEIAYKLNESKSENVAWFQTLGVDATPRLFEGATVYYYGGQYINEVPNPQLNAFAYNLNATVMGSNVVVTFNLNAEAESVAVNFYDGKEKVYTAVSNEVFTAGSHRVTVPVSELNTEDATNLGYDVAVTGKGSLDIRKMGESYKFNSPYGLAINNNPASAGFGQVLVTESRPTEDKADMFSTGTPGALFAFDAAFEPVGSYYGGLEIAGETPLKLFGEYQLDLKDLRFSKDGRLFVARASGLSNSSVYEINPDNLDEAWTPVFTGGELDEATGITYVGEEEQNRPAVGLALEGEGEGLKMYVLGVQGGMEEATPAAFNCAVYDLGAAKEWAAAPTAYVAALDGAYAAIPTHIGIHEDGQGGLWFIQSASTRSEEIPAIKHFDAEGNEDYSDIATNTYSGKMAVTTDGAYLAIPMGSGKVVIYETNYVPMANGSIYLDPKYNISTTESSVTGLAFDYANNLYVASSGSKTLSRYTIPSWNDNMVVTPGNAIGTGSNGDLNGDGKTDIADAVTVLNEMALEEPSMKCDVNGDGKIDIADFVTVLNLMAAQ